MQVHSRKLGDVENSGKSHKLYRWIWIAMAVVAILVAIGIVSIHYAEGNSIISQICYHKGAHLCFFPKITVP
ncbi:MAG: hypothetical protein KGH99_02740 [Thaumarchaeota archaeon]|nr:hypothetical protein [Nitrososphaerota archaeon]MDE1872377.1 hypothetical protein [Nitrososphaerota archaeon]